MRSDQFHNLIIDMWPDIWSPFYPHHLLMYIKNEFREGDWQKSKILLKEVFHIKTSTKTFTKILLQLHKNLLFTIFCLQKPEQPTPPFSGGGAEGCAPLVVSRISYPTPSPRSRSREFSRLFRRCHFFGAGGAKNSFLLSRVIFWRLRFLTP